MSVRIILPYRVHHAIQCGDKGIFERLGLGRKDELHRLVAGEYIKRPVGLHETLQNIDIRKDEVDRLFIVCSLPNVCRGWGRERELTCCRRESILTKSD